MKELEQKILSEGKVLKENVLKVGSFLNQQIDTEFMFKMGEEIARLFKEVRVDKILTIEASGIALAVAAAYFIKVPVVFAKKNKSSNVEGDVYSAQIESFTHKTVYNAVVSKEYIKEGDNILIVDDFLAKGNAVLGLIKLAELGKGKVCGVAAAIEKGFQGGGDSLREKGFKVESLAIIDFMDNGKVVFRN